MRLPVDALRAFVTDALEALGGNAADAKRVAHVLVHADCRGYGTHGASVLPLYRAMIESGAIDPAAEPELHHHTGATLSVDGRNAFGQITGLEATAAGIAALEDHGVAVVGIRNGTHLGALGEYARRAAGSGIVFAAFVNAGGGAKNTAPYGGHGRKLSTNPVAFGVPTFDALPFDVILDVATSQVSGSDIRTHHDGGEPLEDSWTTTESGDAVTDAAAFMEGTGALLPLGGRTTGHKGYGLAVVAELLAGILGDNPVAGERDPDWFANGAAFVFVDPLQFCTRQSIESRVAAFAEHLYEAETNVRLPGEGAHRRAERAREDGIEFSNEVLRQLAALASDIGATPPPAVRSAFEAVDPDEGDVRTW